MVVINKEDYTYAQSLGFIHKKNLFFVPGVGVDLNGYKVKISLKKIREELVIPNGKLLVTCVAEFSKNKNHQLLLQAWQKLDKNVIGDIYLLLVGEGALEKHYRSLVDKENIPHVYFLGFREDVTDILNESDIIVLTSKREGLPRCIMEAMACGKPVIATDVRGSRDLLQHGKTGYLVSSNQVNELVHALERLIKDNNLRKRMGEAGRAAVQSYSIENILQEMELIYERYLPVI